MLIYDFNYMHVEQTVSEDTLKRNRDYNEDNFKDENDTILLELGELNDTLDPKTSKKST